MKPDTKLHKTSVKSEFLPPTRPTQPDSPVQNRSVIRSPWIWSVVHSSVSSSTSSASSSRCSRRRATTLRRRSARLCRISDGDTETDRRDRWLHWSPCYRSGRNVGWRGESERWWCWDDCEGPERTSRGSGTGRRERGRAAEVGGFCGRSCQKSPEMGSLEKKRIQVRIKWNTCIIVITIV